MTSDTHALRASIQYLEREVRWTKIAGMAMLVLVGGALLMGQAAPKGNVVEAQEFILRDEQGNTRSRLGIGEYGPRFLIYDSEGEEHAVIGVRSGELGFHLVSGDGKGLVVLALTSDGSRLILGNDAGHTSIGLNAGRNEGVILISGSEGHHQTLRPDGNTLFGPGTGSATIGH